MKRIIPYRKPFWTGGVWWPWYVPSRTISRHHWYIVRSKSTVPRVISVVEWKWNQVARPDVIKRAATAPVKGQGLGSTIWNACAWWAIKRSLGGIRITKGQTHKPGSLRLQLLVVWVVPELPQWGGLLWVLMELAQIQRLQLAGSIGGQL